MCNPGDEGAPSRHGGEPQSFAAHGRVATPPGHLPFQVGSWRQKDTPPLTSAACRAPCDGCSRASPAPDKHRPPRASLGDGSEPSTVSMASYGNIYHASKSLQGARSNPRGSMWPTYPHLLWDILSPS